MLEINQTSLAIPFDNLTNGFTSSDVQSAIEEARGSIIYYNAKSTSSVSTTSGTFAVVGSMTLTPQAGTYLAIYSSDVEGSNVNAQGEFQFYSGTSPIAGTNQQVELEVALLLGLIGTARLRVGGNTMLNIVTANGTDAINVCYRSVDGNTITVRNRSLILLKVA